MKRLLIPCVCALALCSTALSAEPAAGEEPVLAQLKKLTDKLVAKDGFSDEDAVTAAVFLMKKTVGDPAPVRTLATHVRPTRPGYVKVYVAYNHPRIPSIGYEFEFYHGDRRTTGTFVTMISLPYGRQKEEPLTNEIAAVLRECQKVKPGETTREQLAKIFNEDRGLSTPMQQTFVHHSCPFIKVRIEFKTVAPPAEVPEGKPQDKVSKISAPFLEWSVID
jgi:hypothetical protein